MLDKESLDAYESIQLSRDLRGEILERREKRASQSHARLLRPAAALASLVLVAGISAAVLAHPRTGVYTESGRLGQRARSIPTETVEYTAPAARTTYQISPAMTTVSPTQTAAECIALELKFGTDVCVAVHGGMLIVPDTDGMPAAAGMSAAVADGSTVYWALERTEAPSPLYASVTDPDGNPLACITLTYDAERGEWLADCQKQAPSANPEISA